jgi:hypothetical protein
LGREGEPFCSGRFQSEGRGGGTESVGGNVDKYNGKSVRFCACVAMRRPHYRGDQMLELCLIKDRGLISTVHLKRVPRGTKQRYETAASGCNAEKRGKKLLWKFGVGQQYSKMESPFFFLSCSTSCQVLWHQLPIAWPHTGHSSDSALYFHSLWQIGPLRGMHRV